MTSRILNTPYQIPNRHYRLDENHRATDEIVEGRRLSGNYLSVPEAPTSQRSGGNGSQSELSEQYPPHSRINLIRDAVSSWRAGDPSNGVQPYEGASIMTRRLLQFWSSDSPEPQPFFCQVEALETLVWFLEAGPRLKSDIWSNINRETQQENGKWNESIPRLAVKMATGTGKTFVMAMIVLWQALLRQEQIDVVVITPGLTVRDRLRELDVTQGDGLYRSLLPPGFLMPTPRIRLTLINFQAFQARKDAHLAVAGPDDKPSGVVKELLNRGQQYKAGKWDEKPEEMLDRVLTKHRNSRRIIVINDEAHHCRAPLEGDEETAALWFNALRLLHRQGRLGQVYDLSATPIYNKLPPNLYYELFPWTVSDYPLIEAVEAGLTKIPRVPVEDDTEAEQPRYRNVYKAVEESSESVLLRWGEEGKPNHIPSLVKESLQQLYDHWQNKTRPQYEEVGITPVFIIVANTISNAQALYRYIAGYKDKKGRWHPGTFDAFSNVRPDRLGPVECPVTLLVHSPSKAEAAEGKEITFKDDDAQADFFPRDDLTKGEYQDWLRKIFNTVGQKGEAGENIRCVVSVSMLTEGWDVRTVTHIFGYRPFNSQLLCEQVAGRALRRTSLDTNSPSGMLNKEYANIFGVPFNFMRGDDDPPQPPKEYWPVYTVFGRADQRIVFPNILAYRVEPPGLKCRLNPDKVQPFEITPAGNPTTTEAAGLLGDPMTTQLRQRRRTEILYGLAGAVISRFCEKHGNQYNEDIVFLRRRVLFAYVLQAVEDWLKHPKVEYSPSVLPVVTSAPYNETIPQDILNACKFQDTGAPKIIPVFADETDPCCPRVLSTESIGFKTALKHRYPKETSSLTEHSELNAAACHSQGEVELAAALDEHPGIQAWARNFRLGFKIPYLNYATGAWDTYEPDFIARATDEAGGGHFIIEYKGQEQKADKYKQQATENWWIPAVHGSDDPSCTGRWRYVFIQGVTDFDRQIAEAIRTTSVQKH